LSANAKTRIQALLTGVPALALVLFAVNAFLCRELFVTEYLHFLDSIEGAYIGLARWIMDHPFELQWFPQWYCGIPFQNAYPPLLHFLVAGFASSSGLSPAQAHHAVSAAFYCLGPVTLFWFAWRLSADRWASFFAALLYSTVSFSAWLFPLIAADIGSAFGSRRLQVIARYGEGPHIAAVTLLPVALVALDWALRRRTPLTVFAAAAALAAVVLSNWLGAFALAAAVVCYLFSTAAAGWRRRLSWAMGIGLLAYALAVTWIPPSTIEAIRVNSQRVGGNFDWSSEHLVYGAVFAAVFLALFIALRTFRAPAVVQFSSLFLLFIGTPPAVFYWFSRNVIPQPHRFQIEMEIPAVLLLGFAGAAVIRRLPRKVHSPAAGVVFVLLLSLLIPARGTAHFYLQPLDIQATLPYRMARWLETNLPGERILATGSLRYWLDAFARNPQVGGGFDQGITNAQIPEVTYGVMFNSGDGERAATWMRAYAARAVNASGPESGEVFRDVNDLQKFDGVLPELWRDQDAVIYQIPQAASSLARVIRPEEAVWELKSQYVDASFLDATNAAALDSDRATAEFQWLDSRRARITATLAESELLAVAVTHHSGWSARVDGSERLIRRDALGLMVIEPRCSGECQIELAYDGGPEMRAARLVTLAAIALAPIWWWRRRRH
jgi:hypothetical protein